MNLFDPTQITFSSSTEGELRLQLADGSLHAPVQCRRLFPLTDPDHYISVQRPDDKEEPEIGILKQLADLPSDQRRLVTDDLQHQHFLPEITDIVDIVTLHGMDEWSVVTDRGPITFFVSGRKESMAVTPENLLLVTDIEKCRYRVTDYTTLTPRARLLLDRTLP
jgi:hypothetical protein